MAGEVGQGTARHGRQGWARRGTARHGNARQARLGPARRGTAGKATKKETHERSQRSNTSKAQRRAVSDGDTKRRAAKELLDQIGHSLRRHRYDHVLVPLLEAEVEERQNELSMSDEVVEPPLSRRRRVLNRLRGCLWRARIWLGERIAGRSFDE